jgi:hypothetical protein
MKLTTANQRWLSLLLFVLAFGYFGIDMKVGELLNKAPWGIHQWRQTDGASMALLFYEEGHPIYEPHIHNQLHGSGEAGGEMPLIYYAAGKLYHLIGVNDQVIRWMHLLIVVTGLLCFLWVLGGYMHQALWGAIALLLAFASPTFMYYSANFLPDAGGFGLALIGTSFLLSDQLNPSRQMWVAGLFFFMLTGWVKVSMLIPFIAWYGSLFLLSITKKSEHRRLMGWTIGFVAVLALIFSWYGYIGYYNALFNSTYFATGIRPIWDAEPDHLVKVWDHFFHQWIVDVFPTWMRWTTLFSGLLILLRWRDLPKIWLFWLPLNVLGVTAYFLLFYVNLYEHDYYFLPLYFPVLFIHAAACMAIDRWKRVEGPPWVKWSLFALAALVTYGAIVHAVKRNKKTYFGWYQDLDTRDGFFNIAGFLDEEGIEPDAKCFVAQDFSSNQRLYFLRRKGWTQLSGVYDSDQLDPLIAKGAAYAVVPDTSFHSVTFLQYHILDTVGYHEGIGVYRIGHSKWWKGKESAE